jgi:proteasome lid subunit RPN8/RPN11
MLTEPQIQRYARQLLLRDVGEQGQEALGAIGVTFALGGEVASAAAAYLRAGGTEVTPAADGRPPWAGTPPLLGSAGTQVLAVVAAPAWPEHPGVVLGARGGAHVLWSGGKEGCAACLHEVTRELTTPSDAGPASVQVGSLLALLVQRRALGIAAPLEGLEVSESGALGTLAAPVCPHRPPRLPPVILRELVRHLEAALPDEGCAVLLARGDSVRVVPMENAQAAHHARDPEAFPRSARMAFSLDPRAWLAVLRQADRGDEQVLAIAHSHPDGGEGFSAEDRRWAAPDGLPLLPGVAHLVVAFRGGAARSARWAIWNNGDFLELDCPLPEVT